MSRNKALAIGGVSVAVLAVLAFLLFKFLPITSFGSETVAYPSGEGPVSAHLSDGTVSGYLSAEYEGNDGTGDVFLACGTDGRLDRIYQDGRVENITVDTGAHLTRVFITGDVVLVAGTGGTILYSGDGRSFEKRASSLDSDILGITSFNGLFYACASDGSVVSSEDGREWGNAKKLGKTPIISIAANDEYIMAVTAETDIWICRDGETWEVQNFTEYYKGFYDPYVFVNMVNLGSTFFVLGYVADDPGSPIIMFTDNAGETWLFKSLTEINDKEPTEYYPLRVNYISVFTEQLMAACDKGRLLTVTECSVCNTISQASGADLYAMALSDENMLVAGKDFEYAVLDAEDLRNDDITASQALEDFLDGAVIVDVRTDEEYGRLHIKGSLHIPLEEIAERLPFEVPDPETELIFYCEKGVRSQEALEKARELGYMNVYNLGGIGDWPYEVES